jgi:hypothetical protein
MKKYYTAANDFTIIVDNKGNQKDDSDSFGGVEVALTDMNDVMCIAYSMDWEDDGETKYINRVVETIRQLAATFVTVANDLEKLKEKE